MMALEDGRTQSAPALRGKRGNGSVRLSLSDVTCPICLSLIVEPVTLPCRHELCRECFHQSLRTTSLTCPVCRLRLSSWTRTATREKRLVNTCRWTEIKNAFPNEVRARLNGRDVEHTNQQSVSDYRPLSEPGAIRKEFEQQMKQWIIEQDKQKQENDETSLSDVLKTIYKEQTLEKSLEASDDGVCPHKPLAHGKDKISHKNKHLAANECFSVKKPRSWSPESNDSITQELCHFKPIKIAPKTPPKVLPDGSIVEPVLVVTTPRNLGYPSHQENEPVPLCKSMRKKLSRIGTERKASKKLDVNLQMVKPTTSKEERIPASSSEDCIQRVEQVERQPKRRGRPRKFSPQASASETRPPVKCSNSKTTVALQSVTAEPSPLPGTSKHLSHGTTELECTIDKASCSKFQSPSVDTPNMLETEAILAQQMRIMQQLKQEELDRQLAHKLQEQFNAENEDIGNVGLRSPYKLRKRTFDESLSRRKCRRMMS